MNNQKSSESLWVRFQGLTNTNDVLVEKAESLAPLLVGLAGDNAITLIEQINTRKNVDEKFEELLFETMIFYFHLVDRLAFEYLGNEKRNIFIDTLLVKFPIPFSNVFENSIDIDQFLFNFVNTYNQRQADYVKYKWSPGEAECFKNTLLWEFANIIACVVGLNKDLSVIMDVELHVVFFIEILKFRELFGHPRN